TPYKFDVNEEEWFTHRNRERFRKQSPIKEEEIFLQVEVMVNNEIISSSDADAWSQVMLTPKPNMKWRFAIDFRRLNETLLKKGFPIPRIKEIIDQIASRKPNVFGKMDLTHGYHQIPIDEECRDYTTFITSRGLYKWNRLPMGLTNAGQYFQKILRTEVLCGLSDHVVIPYLDDMHLATQTEEEFIENLREVLKRFDKHNIFVNPSKCFFGLDKLEILGHEISKEGTTFSREKLQGVNDFPLPITSGNLMSYLGLCNYFRENIKDYAKLEEPLRKMVKPNKLEKLIWLQNELDAFKKLKDEIYNMPLLFFIDDKLPIYLNTDACESGIGGYLYQVKEGKEVPIGFYSSKLRGSELQWNTYEKEAYAVYMSVCQFQYLLTDAKFTIKTDHKNLLYMNQNDSSNKVLRWKMFLQQFDFDLQHIPGKENIPADLASRLYEGETQRTINMASFQLANIHDETEMNHMDSIEDIHRIEYEKHDEIINQYHNSTVGHHGFERTMRLLKERAHKTWKGMRKNVREFINKCPHCQFMQDVQLKLKLIPYHVMTWRPMDRLNIDHIGPFPKDEQGNVYILVCIDVFSRFVELIPVPDREAVTTAKATLQWIGRYGTPYELLSDNAPEYLSNVMQELLKLADIEHLKTLPYSHEENSVVERANKEVVRHLKAIVFDKKLWPSWSIVLPIVQRIMNSMVNRNTGQTPASIIFGNMIDLDKNILYKTEPNVDETTLSEYITKLLTLQARAIHLAQETQKSIIQKYDATHQIPEGYDNELPLNSYVILEYGKDYIHKPNKLAMNFRGPYKIININGDRYTLLNLLNDKTITVHRMHIRAYKQSEHITPEEVARNMATEFKVESVLNIQGNRNKNRQFLRTDLELLVKWEGYEESYNSWEPFSEIKSTEAFKQYCLNNNLQYLIPKQYKANDGVIPV
ncbi:MAG TPA: hypothetical protein DHV86_06465, partial [Methylophilaceae bacterium]|nr:hypothetical protein [Methylophilaceae bacterium]